MSTYKRFLPSEDTFNEAGRRYDDKHFSNKKKAKEKKNMKVFPMFTYNVRYDDAYKFTAILHVMNYSPV